MIMYFYHNVNISYNVAWSTYIYVYF